MSDADPPAARVVGRSPLATLWDARWLLYQWVRRDFTVQYRQSLLGLAWAVAQPLLLLVVYGTVFETVLDLAPEGKSYIVFALCGLVPWTFLSTALLRSVGALTGAAPLVKQVYFPRVIIPLASTGVTVVDLALSTLILLAAQLVTSHKLHAATLALIPIYACLVLLMAAIATLASFVGALVRDIRFLMPLVTQLGFIATPVMYPRSAVPDRFVRVYDLNPVAQVIEAIRRAVVDGRWPSPLLLGGLLLVSMACLYLSISYAAAVEDRLPDLL